MLPYLYILLSVSRHILSNLHTTKGIFQIAAYSKYSTIIINSNYLVRDLLLSEKMTMMKKSKTKYGSSQWCFLH